MKAIHFKKFIKPRLPKISYSCTSFEIDLFDSIFLIETYLLNEKNLYIVHIPYLYIPFML